MEAFENTFDNYYWLAHIVQDTLLIIYNETNIVIFEKINSILKTLNIEDKQPEKFLTRFRTFFQEYFLSIFSFTEEILNRIKTKLNKITLKYKNFDEILNQGLKRDIESKSFKTLCQMSFKLCIYMLLHEPQLSLSIQAYEKREFTYSYYSKTDHLNIEGFGNDHSSCITILSPPMLRNYFPFQGIKPSVYIIPDPDDEIIKCCEKNKVVKKVSSHELSSTNTEKASSSPVKLEKNECVNKENEPITTSNNIIPSPNLSADSKLNHKLAKNIHSNPIFKEQPVQVVVNTIKDKDKIPVSYLKFNKNYGKDIIISESNTLIK